ncbi:TatD family hydrolase [Fontivita pretiosa]|uniref:TatD family hydrolase n=1 Tax=Fontivita pretiosa TaxID=2989684 RepID=UPI003D174778
MIDSHCHLTDPRLLEQFEAVMSRAAVAGVSRMITIGTDPDDDAAAIELCRRRPDALRCAIGIHPNYCHEVEESRIDELREMQRDPMVVALGEMGLDYHYDFADRARQRKFFQRQLDLAAELARPVVIHNRRATDDCLAILRDYPSVPALFHCFTGSLEEGERILERGYCLGFTGVVTFKKSDELREMARRTPADRLFMETDAPYLTPEPVRKQKINEPAMVMHTAMVLAQVRGMSIEQIDQITTDNVGRFFGWRE